MTTHSCPKCNYTTTRMFNLDRHIRSRHESELLKSSSSLLKSSSNLLKSSSSLLKSSSSLLKSSSPTSTCTTTCNKCNKTFTRHNYMLKHTEKCDGTAKGCCKYCKQHFANTSALYRHRKICKESSKNVSTENSLNNPPSISIVNNIVINGCVNSNNNTNNVSNNVSNQTVNLLAFPEDDPTSADWDFVTKNITQAIMKQCMMAAKAEVGFNKFMGVILDHPENQIVRKTNVNTNYSKIHVGNGKWKFASDADVLPAITHHMTTAALAKISEFKTLRSICDQLHSHVEKINTDDSCDEYLNAIQRLKLHIVNITKEIEEADKLNRLNMLQFNQTE